MIRIYGRASSRASRCLWVLEELELPYEHVPLDYEKGEAQQPEFLALNPSGKIPFMTDHAVHLSESMAIALHIAETYGQGRLWPADRPDQARCRQWAFWAVSELEPHAQALLDEILFKPDPTQRNEQVLARARQKADAALATLEAALAQRDVLVGEAFSVADICVASVVKWLKGIKHDLTRFPHVSSWLAASLNRPANQKVLGIKKSAAGAP
ncbi:MAG: glutathione S-transferase family protein [Rhodospirillaceae bacterium]|nr:glutathione S-transferase family protein [Rhodospirillaceae bacterium]